MDQGKKRKDLEKGTTNPLDDPETGHEIEEDNEGLSSLGSLVKKVIQQFNSVSWTRLLCARVKGPLLRPFLPLRGFPKGRSDGG